MKKIAALLMLTLPIFIIAFMLPTIAMAVIPKVELTRLSTNTYQPYVSVSGKIEELYQNEIECSFPVVVKQVYVSVGDYVQAGQAIAQIDFEETKKAILQMASLSDSIPQQAIEVLSYADLDYDVLLSQIPNQITSDVAGTVSSLNFTPGSILYPSQAIATISNLNTLRANVQVSEEFAEDIQTGQEVSLKSNAIKGETFTGTVDTIFPTAHDTLVGTSQETVVGMYIHLPADTPLKSGYSVSGKVYTGQMREFYIINYEAINQDDNGQEYVYVYQNGKAMRRDIQTGIETEDGIEVTHGLFPSDYIISDCSKISSEEQYINVVGVK